MVVVFLLLLLSLDIFFPTSAHHLLILDKRIVQICLSINSMYSKEINKVLHTHNILPIE